MLFDVWQNLKVSFPPSVVSIKNIDWIGGNQTKSPRRQHPTAKLCNDMISQIFQCQYFAMPKATSETSQVFPGLLCTKSPAQKFVLLVFCIYEQEGT